MSKLLNYTTNDILDLFPRLADLGCGAFGEDADTFGDTLRDVIQDEPQTRVLSFKWQTISELRTLLAGSDADIESVSEAVLGIIPTVAPEEPPNWGSFSNLRAFWSAVLHAFENDPEVQAGREIDPDV
ncbi:hypothetical protein [Acetobacter sp. LMG 32666]|uniref:hypothetical protein n=1 Tax=Acetobacter sp. LMG 32666 TaxID=2959295 RepID=UPI0030C80147